MLGSRPVRRDKLRRFWRDYSFFIVLIAISAPIGVGLAVEEQRRDREWQTFAEEHNCKIVIADKPWSGTAWLCDDGVTYWR